MYKAVLKNSNFENIAWFDAVQYDYKRNAFDFDTILLSIDIDLYKEFTECRFIDFDNRFYFVVSKVLEENQLVLSAIEMLYILSYIHAGSGDNPVFKDKIEGSLEYVIKRILELNLSKCLLPIEIAPNSNRYENVSVDIYETNILDKYVDFMSAYNINIRLDYDDSKKKFIFECEKYRVVDMVLIGIVDSYKMKYDYNNHTNRMYLRNKNGLATVNALDSSLIREVFVKDERITEHVAILERAKKELYKRREKETFEATLDYEKYVEYGLKVGDTVFLPIEFPDESFITLHKQIVSVNEVLAKGEYKYSYELQDLIKDVDTVQNS